MLGLEQLESLVPLRSLEPGEVSPKIRLFFLARKVPCLAVPVPEGATPPRRARIPRRSSDEFHFKAIFVELCRNSSRATPARGCSFRRHKETKIRGFAPAQSKLQPSGTGPDHSQEA